MPSIARFQRSLKNLVTSIGSIPWNLPAGVRRHEPPLRRRPAWNVEEVSFPSPSYTYQDSLLSSAAHPNRVKIPPPGPRISKEKQDEIKNPPDDTEMREYIEKLDERWHKEMDKRRKVERELERAMWENRQLKLRVQNLRGVLKDLAQRVANREEVDEEELSFFSSCTNVDTAVNAYFYRAVPAGEEE